MQAIKQVINAFHGVPASLAAAGSSKAANQA